MKNIVACFDFSGVTSEVIEMASTLATALGTKLYLLHVVYAPVQAIEIQTAPTPHQTVAAQMHRAREAINELREPLFQHGIDVSTILVEEHLNVVRAIIDESERVDAGVIVMGSHGHGALYRMLVGSTAEGVMRRAKCPVLLVPSRSLSAVEAAASGAAGKR